MSGKRFATSSLDPLLRRQRSGGGKRELGRRIEPRIPDASASSNRSPTSGMSHSDGLSTAPVSNSPAHGPRSTAAGLRIGSLPYLVLIALVAVGITGAFFGSGFLLLKQPAREPVSGPTARNESPSAVPEAPASNLPVSGPTARDESPSAAPASPAPNLNAAPALPDPPAAQSATVPEATPTASPVPAMLPAHNTKRRLTTGGHHHHSRLASQHSHARSAPVRESFFDRLLSRLLERPD